MNYKKGAISTGAAVAIVVVIIIIAALAYWYISANPGMLNQTSTTASSTAVAGTDNGTAGQGSSVSTTASGDKEYSNFTYNYAIAFPPDAQNSLSTANDVTFGFSNGTSTAGTLSIAVNNDVSHLAYCLTVPQGAKAVATTTVNGVPFLSYTVSTTDAANSGTTYYRLLHNAAPYGNLCYDIQKMSQGSATLSTKLNTVLNSFTFIK